MRFLLMHFGEDVECVRSVLGGASWRLRRRPAGFLRRGAEARALHPAILTSALQTVQLELGASSR